MYSFNPLRIKKGREDSFMPHVWYVQNRPFDSSRRYSQESIDFQNTCFDRHIFGMGWRPENIEQYEAESEINDDIAKQLRNQINSNGFTRAQNLYSRICVNDIALLHHTDGNYYLGRVLNRPRFESNGRFTWYAQVDDWRNIGSSIDLPPHVKGKLSAKKYQNTIAEIDGFAAYTLLNLGEFNNNNNKIPINKNNFFLALSPDDLEDLVADYMQKCNPNFVCLPSSCKKNTPGIEYVMYNTVNSELIACQTKIDRSINVDRYEEEAFKQYSKIYLFSGVGYNNVPTQLSSNIEIIDNNNLYDTFRNNSYFQSLIKEYFSFEE